MPAPSTKADFIISAIKGQILFSDIPTNFDMSPNSGDLAKVTNIAAVQQSLENIILTIVNERPYLPYIGSTVQFRAFELASVIETQLITSAIQLAVRQNEPRVNLVNVDVNVFGDTESYNIIISFYVINNPTLQTLSVLLKRTR